ncbi:MAG: S16 family serine protease [Verrucomicrobiota bacterium]
MRILAFIVLLLVAQGSLLMAELLPLQPDTKSMDQNVFSKHPAEANSLATAVVDWIKLKYSQSEELEARDWEALSKALAVAKIIAPENPEMLVLEFQLKQKASLQEPATVPVSELGSIVYGLMNQLDMKNSIQGPDKKLYGYLLEVAALMNPQNSEIVLAHMQNSGGKNDWSKILVYPAPVQRASTRTPEELAALRTRHELVRDKNGMLVPKHMVDNQDKQAKKEEDVGEEPKRDQALIKILLVTQGASDIWVGSTNDLIATVSSEKSKSLQAKFQDKIIAEEEEDGSPVGRTGKQMNIALDEALRLVRSQHKKAVGNIELSFEDKYTPKDGGSLGLASALVLSSLYDDFDIDPDLAVTGDISADGSVRAVGAIAAKLDGADYSRCKLAIIPSENIDSISTVLINRNSHLLKNVQVFSAATYSEALEIASVKKSENVQKAIDEFNRIKQAGMKRESIADLEQVLEWAPNHLSAQAMIDVLTGNVPKTYSLKESVNQIMSTASPFVSILLTEKNQAVTLSNRGGFTIPEIPDRLISETQRKLNKLSSKLDPDTKDLHSAVMDVVYAWSDFQKRGHNSSTSREQFIEAREDFHLALDDLRYDEEALKDLLR